MAGTYLIAAAACGGEISLRGADAGAAVLRLRDSCEDRCESGVRRGPDLLKGGGAAGGRARRHRPYPGFPTDLQSPLLALCCVARGESVIEETVFEGRFKTAGELARLGAAIGIDGARPALRGGSAWWADM